jgi:hypothetical protein
MKPQHKLAVSIQRDVNTLVEFGTQKVLAGPISQVGVGSVALFQMFWE